MMNAEYVDSRLYGPMSSNELDFQDFLNQPNVGLLTKCIANPPLERVPYRENYSHDVFEVLRLYFGYIVPYEVLSLTIFNSTDDKLGVDYSIRSLRRAGYFQSAEFNTFKDLGVALGVHSMPLEPMTYVTFKHLWNCSGKKVNRDELIRSIWGYEGPSYNEYAGRVQECISRLRGHLYVSHSEFSIKTSYGNSGGYKYMLIKNKKVW